MKDNGSKKFQWSAFSKDRLQQWVVRTDDEKEFDGLVKKYQDKMPKVAFPNDPSGPVATPVEKAIDPAPTCVVCKSTKILRPAGVSKDGRKYRAFWACPTRNPDGSYCKEPRRT